MTLSKACFGLSAWLLCGAAGLAQECLTETNFHKLHQLVRPQAEESKWLRVPWLINVTEARKKAAEEGKPLFIWSGGGCPPLGSC